MNTLRRYLDHYCHCDATTIERHIAADAAGDPLPLPGLANWALLNPIIAAEAARHAAYIAQERAERPAAALHAKTVAPAYADTGKREVLVVGADQGFAAEMRRSQIMRTYPAQIRPSLAAKLAMDASLSMDQVLHRLNSAPVEVENPFRTEQQATAPASVSMTAEERMRREMQAAYDQGPSGLVLLP